MNEKKDGIVKWGAIEVLFDEPKSISREEIEEGIQHALSRFPGVTDTTAG